MGSKSTETEALIIFLFKICALLRTLYNGDL